MSYEPKLRQDGEIDLRTVPKDERPPKHIVVVSTSVRLFTTSERAHAWIKDNSSDEFIQHRTYVFDV
jgi:hypothetical protein